MLYGLSGGLGVVVLRYLPGGFHHFDEVLIRWGAHGEVAIVVIKLFPCDDPVFVASGSFEGVQEVGQNLVTCLSTFEEKWIHANIVNTGNILDGDFS